MFCGSNHFKPKALHFYNVKDLPIEIRRKEWRMKESDRRKRLFSSISPANSLFAKICSYFRK